MTYAEWFSQTFEKDTRITCPSINPTYRCKHCKRCACGELGGCEICQADVEFDSLPNEIPESLLIGIEQAAAGDIHDLGSFLPYIDN